MFIKIELSKEGFKLIGRNSETVYLWSDVKRVRHVAGIQVIHLYDIYGKKIISVTEQLCIYKFNNKIQNHRPWLGFRMLIQCLKQYSGAKLSWTLEEFSQFFLPKQQREYLSSHYDS